MKVLHVEWLDSETVDGWTPLAELDADLESTHTVGFLIHESAHFLLIAHSHDPATESANGLITIPKAAIKKQQVIMKVKS